MTSLTHTLSSLSEKATQGEWLYSTGPALTAIFHEVIVGDTQVCECYSGDDERQQEHNARFIVAIVNAWRSARLRVSDELDAATAERCARIAERWLESSWRDEVFAAKSIASAVRSLIPNSANEITARPTEDAGSKPAVDADASATDVAVAGSIPAAPAKCTCPDDWQGMDHTSGCKSRASRDPAVTQDCAPAGTVSALNSQYAGLEALLAAIHADDPKRELLVRVGDLMRENRVIASGSIREKLPPGEIRILERLADDLEGSRRYFALNTLEQKFLAKAARALLSQFDVRRK